MPPGVYQVSAVKPGYTFQGRGELTVPPRGCGWWQAEAKSNGKISLRVVSESGAPVAKLPLTLLYEAGDKLKTLPLEGSRETNASGFIELSGLPAATLVISVNPKGPRGTDAPYPTTYFPNVREASQATRIRLGPSEQSKD